MKENNTKEFFHTNLEVFYNIAIESFYAMNADINANRKPKPNNEHGWILTYNPDQKSFKNAFITIVFCGVFLEALLHLLIVERKGIEIYIQLDKKRATYELQLESLGCNDPSIIKCCKNFRDARNEVIHEKAHMNTKDIRRAQDEATKAFEFIRMIIKYFALKGFDICLT